MGIFERERRESSKSAGTSSPAVQRGEDGSTVRSAAAESKRGKQSNPEKKKRYH
jgi:hypothetical protein